jgi:hypothetical protein
MSQLTARQLIDDAEHQGLTGRIPLNRIRAIKGLPNGSDNIYITHLPNGITDIKVNTRDGKLVARAAGFQRVLGDVIYHATANGNILLAMKLEKGIKEVYKTATPQEKILLDNLKKYGADVIARSYDNNAYDNVMKQFFSNPQYKDILKRVGENAYGEVEDAYYYTASGEKIKKPVIMRYESPQPAQQFVARGHGEPVVAPMIFATRTTPSDFIESLPNIVLDQSPTNMPRVMADMIRSGRIPKDKILWIDKIWQAGGGQGEYEVYLPLGFKTYNVPTTEYSGGLKTMFPKTYTTSMFNYKGEGRQISVGDKIPIYWEATKNALAEGKGVPTKKELYLGKLYGDLTLIRQYLPWNWRFRAVDTENSDTVTVSNPISSAIKQLTLKAVPENEKIGRASAIIKDDKGRVLLVRTKGSETFDLPGGGVAKGNLLGLGGETAKEATKLEVW